MKIVKEHIFEEKIGKVRYGDYKGYEIFINPPTIKNFENCKAISDINGNLYVTEYQDYHHQYLITWLINNKFIDLGFSGRGKIPHPYYIENVIAWHQFHSTNNLFLFEASDKYYKKGIHKMVKLVRQKNPNIEFKLTNIHDAWEFWRVNSYEDSRKKFGRGIKMNNF